MVIPLVVRAGDPSQDWRVLANSYAVGRDREESLGVAAEMNVDTGASYLYLPKAVADTYNKHLGAKVLPEPGSLVSVPCVYEGRPDLVLSFPSGTSLGRRVTILPLNWLSRSHGALRTSVSASSSRRRITSILLACRGSYRWRGPCSIWGFRLSQSSHLEFNRHSP